MSDFLPTVYQARLMLLSIIGPVLLFVLLSSVATPLAKKFPRLIRVLRIITFSVMCGLLLAALIVLIMRACSFI